MDAQFWWCFLTIFLLVQLSTIIVLLKALCKHELSEVIDALKRSTCWEVTKVIFEAFFAYFEWMLVTCD